MKDATTPFPAQQPPGTEHPLFPRLFSPIKIGPMTAKNRVVNSAHGTGFGRDGVYTDQLIAYQKERARGGAAIILSQAIPVTGDHGDITNADDSIIPWYQKVAAEVHLFGAHYFSELSHAGRQARPDSGAFDAPITYGPSAVPPAGPVRGGWGIPHELEPEQIRAIIGHFGAAAGRCRQGNLDGIELHFAHGNLAQQFMSPATNQRTDEWGGSLSNRLRFAREVLHSVREAVGRDLAVGCRLTGSELDEGGLSQLEMLEIAGLLDETKMLDYFSVTMGHYSDLRSNLRNIPDMSFTPGVWADFGDQIKHLVNVPVFLVGRVNHPAVAEDLIAKGRCDMVVMARALIADPYFPSKAFSRQVDDIRPCVGAKDGCSARREGDRPIRCIYNPVVSREREWGGDPPPASQAREVVVIGGGPAGLECARVAASGGHRVVLLERQKVLGGQVNVAARAPAREELAQTIEWLSQQCRKAGVEVRLNTEVTVEQVLRMAPDVVVVATGALPGPQASVAVDGPQVVDAWAVLEGAVEVGRRVLVVDETGLRPGLSVADYLASRGHDVEYVTPFPYPGRNIDWIGWYGIYPNLLQNKVKFHPLTSVSKVDGERVTVKNVYTAAEEPIDGIATVVTSVSPRAIDALYRGLKDKVKHLYLIGDAMAPRGIEEATFEGQKVAREI